MKLTTPCRSGLMAVALLTVAACNSKPDAPAPSPSATPEMVEPVSIFRPEAEVDRTKAPLEPLEMTVSFADGGVEVTDAARADLLTVLNSLQMKEGGVVTLRGHTDSAGFDKANLRVSQRRAEAVRDFLIENGIAAERISVIALGEMRPVAPNANPDGTIDEAGRAANRRVDVTVAIPGAPQPDTDESAEDDATREPSPTLVEAITSPD